MKTLSTYGLHKVFTFMSQNNRLGHSSTPRVRPSQCAPWGFVLLYIPSVSKVKQTRQTAPMNTLKAFPKQKGLWSLQRNTKEHKENFNNVSGLMTWRGVLYQVVKYDMKLEQYGKERSVCWYWFSSNSASVTCTGENICPYINSDHTSLFIQWHHPTCTRIFW